MEASVPWPPAEAGVDGHGYRLTPTPRHWQDLTAFGRLSSTAIEAAGARIRLAVTDAAPRADDAAIAEWIGEAARAVGTLYGRFPLPSPQVVVVPIGRRAEPVPWAQVQRGGGAAAHFFVDQHRPLDEFREDWTATHELSHMLLPHVSRDDAWLSEGVASYYQNVLRARAGMIRPEEAWEKLYAGFGRGRAEADEATLAEASARMHERGVFMRVYWSGAAIALIADVALRRESGGERSMDAALEGLADCCLPSYRTWTARELLTRLDALEGFLSEPGHWWCDDTQTGTLLDRFCGTLHANFGKDARAWQLLEDETHRDTRCMAIVDALAAYRLDRQSWERVLQG
jgi:hypothetical protein